MKRFIWSTVYEDGELVPYYILECADEAVQQIETLRGKEKKKELWKFIADRLHDAYPDEFPTWLDKDGNRHPFWYDNVLEDYDKAYGRLIKEEMKIIKDNIDYNFEYNFHYMIMEGIIGLIDDENTIKETAERSINEDLESLPVYVI